MGLLSRFSGASQQSSGGSSASGVADIPGLPDMGKTSINDIQYDWGRFVKGDFSSFKKITPEDAEASERTAKEMQEQEKLYRRKNTADTQSLDSARKIHNNEQFHTRQRLNKTLDARDHAVRTQETLATKIAPGLHEQNQRLGLAQAKGQQEIQFITAKFEQRRSALQQLRGER